jgi:hypoxanthine phosphoribosyltransferase
MALTPENRSVREQNMYFNKKRVDDFDSVKGETILVDDIDATGKPMKRAITAPNDLREFAYLGYDMLVEFFKKSKEEE